MKKIDLALSLGIALAITLTSFRPVRSIFDNAARAVSFIVWLLLLTVVCYAVMRLIRRFLS